MIFAPKTTFAGLCAASAVAALVVMVPAVSAQTAGAEAPMDASSIAETELDAFVRATISMAEVRENYIEQIAGAGSDAEQEALVEEGNAAMLAALDEAPGISVERYFAINAAAQEDAELNQRIVLLLQEIAAEG